MSTTTTDCAGCLDSDLTVVLGHDCPNDIRRFLRPRTGVTLTPADSVDLRPQGDGSGRGRSNGGPLATEAQLRFIATLAGERGRTVDTDGLTKRAASALIDELKATPAATTDAGQPVRSDCRPNRYPADCHRCGRHVAAEAGELCKADGRWLVSCAGECAPVDVIDAGPSHQVAQVPAGHYAIPSTGDNDLAFYRVDRPEKGTYAGRTFVKLIVGGHPDRNVRRSAVAGILERIAADPDAGARYGREVGRCCVCNRTLTDESSRRAGIGPECAKRA